MYKIGELILFRNDIVSHNERPHGGTAVYSRIDYYPGYPYCYNQNGIEITVMRFMIIPQIMIIAIYRSPAIPIRQLCTAVKRIIGIVINYFKNYYRGLQCQLVKYNRKSNNV